MPELSIATTAKIFGASQSRNLSGENVVTAQIAQIIGTPDELTIVGPVINPDRLARLNGLNAWLKRPVQSLVRHFDDNVGDIVFGEKPKMQPGALLISYMSGSYGSVADDWTDYANPGTNKYYYWSNQKYQILLKAK